MIDLVAQLVRASTSGLCRAEHYRFDTPCNVRVRFLILPNSPRHRLLAHEDEQTEIWRLQLFTSTTWRYIERGLWRHWYSITINRLWVRSTGRMGEWLVLWIGDCIFSRNCKLLCCLFVVLFSLKRMFFLLNSELFSFAQLILHLFFCLQICSYFQ